MIGKSHLLQSQYLVFDICQLSQRKSIGDCDISPIAKPIAVTIAVSGFVPQSTKRRKSKNKKMRRKKFPSPPKGGKVIVRQWNENALLCVARFCEQWKKLYDDGTDDFKGYIYEWIWYHGVDPWMSRGICPPQSPVNNTENVFMRWSKRKKIKGRKICFEKPKSQIYAASKYWVETMLPSHWTTCHHQVGHYTAE